ncbi:O-acetyl-ADP-ribose deacetylase [Limibacter armeniacum]|uniref:O-acetyl-ADP-ribose deacetylase n=1 Tax=Limibacter armeniacum TaxID=466084 RepID=UPI002FE68720
MMEIRLIKGDITKIEVDAIVNAANTSLLGGGGVDGAIHRVGGPQILEECRKIRARQGGCKVGEAVITTAGNLNAKFVIHTVGPRWNEGNSNEAEKLKNCYINSLKLASENGIKSIAFPNISTGIYGYPLEEAADIAIKTVTEADFPEIKSITFVCFGDDNYRLYDKKIKQL